MATKPSYTPRWGTIYKKALCRPPPSAFTPLKLTTSRRSLAQLLVQFNFSQTSSSQVD